MPLVSVIVPTRDRAPLVERAARSVLAQTHGELELVVVDDASTDETVERLRGLDDERLRIIERATPSGGASTPRNEGMATARGDWVAFCDSDDEWRDDKIAVQLDAVAPDDALVYSRCLEMHVSGEQTIFPTYETTPELPHGDCVVPLLRANFVATSTMMVRRRWVRTIGDFDPRMVASEDWEYCLRIALAGGRFAAVDDATATYHFHDRNISYGIDWGAADLAMLRSVRTIAGPRAEVVERRAREVRRRIRRNRVRRVIRGLRPAEPATG